MARIEADEIDRAGRRVVQPNPQGPNPTPPLTDDEPQQPTGDVEPGRRLAGRYRLDRLTATASDAALWRAHDEKLNRSVGVHVLAADDARAERVITAARESTMVTDVRFVQVLDAVIEDGLAYVVTEWIGDGRSLAELLADGPLPVDMATWLASEVAAAMAAAHEADLYHLELGPADVLRTPTGQVKILGLQIAAALRDTVSDEPKRTDARLVGSVLYAALTTRWPLGNRDGLLDAPHEGGRLCSPAQVRAGVPHVVDELVTRMLVDPPPRGNPLDTPAAIAAALRSMPRHRPAAQPPPRPAVETTQALGGPRQLSQPAPPPPLSSNAGKLAKVLVAVVLVVGLGLLGWQLAGSGGGKKRGTPSATSSRDATPVAATKLLNVTGASLWDSNDDSEHPGDVERTLSSSPGSGWSTKTYYGYANLGNLKPGTGIIYNLGSPQTVRSARVTIGAPGATVQMLAADPGVTAVPPITDSAPPGFHKVASVSNAPQTLTLHPSASVRTQFVLIWFTVLPYQSSGSDYQGPGYRDSILGVRLYG